MKALSCMENEEIEISSLGTHGYPEEACLRRADSWQPVTGAQILGGLSQAFR